jgi:hypothetical protein
VYSDRAGDEAPDGGKPASGGTFQRLHGTRTSVTGSVSVTWSFSER